MAAIEEHSTSSIDLGPGFDEEGYLGGTWQ